MKKNSLTSLPEFVSGEMTNCMSVPFELRGILRILDRHVELLGCSTMDAEIAHHAMSSINEGFVCHTEP